MNLEQLRALRAIVDEGSFESAAVELGVTPSAVSQRIRALETSIGRVLVRRGQPCEATDAGGAVIRLARQLEWLEAEMLEAIDAVAAPATASIAVNADSLATWFPAVFSGAARRPNELLRLHVADEGVSPELLRRGEVVGAVTADARPVHGCRIEPLGVMRYVPVASPVLRADHGGDAFRWASAPVLQFDGDDRLQLRHLAAHGVRTAPPTHRIPSNEAFLAAIEAGLGWGLVPEIQLGDRLERGALELLDDGWVDVELHWQRWSIDSPRLERLSELVGSVAAAALRPPGPRAARGAGRRGRG